jgi:hypothetical protein
VAKLTILTMISVASTLGVVTKKPTAHTNKVSEGLLNPTFCNAVELVVTTQALLAY